MSTNADSTHHARPAPNRPENGFLAWQATIGYIASEYSPDALLTIHILPGADGKRRWQAAATWGSITEQVRDKPSLAAALSDLWREVERHHTIFKTLEATARRPLGYAADQWLDTDTSAILTRLLHSATTLGPDWRLMLVYQPAAIPQTRVQARLTARHGDISAGGRGATLSEACRALFRNTAPEL